MPFKSEKQRRFFYWAAAHHKKGFTKKMVRRWQRETHGRLPLRAKKARKRRR